VTHEPSELVSAELLPRVSRVLGECLDLWPDLTQTQLVWCEGFILHQRHTLACTHAGVGLARVAKWRNDSADFAEVFDALQKAMAWILEDHAKDLATGDKPDAQVLMFLLRGLIPERYNRSVLNGASGAEKSTTVINVINTERESESCPEQSNG